MLLLVVNIRCCASEKQVFVVDNRLYLAFTNSEKMWANEREELKKADFIAKQHKKDEFSYFTMQPVEFLENPHKFKTKSTD